MVILLPMGLTERSNRLPKTVTALTITIWLTALTQFAFLSRHGFEPEAVKRWFEALGFNLSQPLWITAFTGLLVHTDFWHATLNTLSLWLFGWFVEDAMGWRKFAVLGLTAHILALATQTAFRNWQGQAEPSFLVGSSAVVAFAMGAFCIRFRHVGLRLQILHSWRWRKREIVAPLWWLAAIWLGMQFWFLAFQTLEKPSIAHLTGFAFGAIAALLLGWHRLALCEELRRRAELMEVEGQWIGAAETWSQVARNSQEEPLAWLSASFCFLNAGELRKAEEALQRALAHLVWNEGSLRKARQIAQNLAAQNLPLELLFSFAEQLERHRCYSEALLLFQRVSSVAEFNKAPQALLKVAELHWRLGDETKAFQALHSFWLRYGQSAWRQEALSLASQFRWRGEKR